MIMISSPYRNLYYNVLHDHRDISMSYEGHYVISVWYVYGEWARYDIGG